MNNETKGSKMQNLERINELARILNMSSGDWLDTWNRATTSYATSADRQALAKLAGDKAQAAKELEDLLTSL
jgi:hypothetical protein